MTSQNFAKRTQQDITIERTTAYAKEQAEAEAEARQAKTERLRAARLAAQKSEA